MLPEGGGEVERERVLLNKPISSFMPFLSTFFCLSPNGRVGDKRKSRTATLLILVLKIKEVWWPI